MHHTSARVHPNPLSSSNSVELARAIEGEDSQRALAMLERTGRDAVLRVLQCRAVPFAQCPNKSCPSVQRGHGAELVSGKSHGALCSVKGPRCEQSVGRWIAARGLLVVSVVGVAVVYMGGGIAIQAALPLEGDSGIVPLVWWFIGGLFAFGGCIMALTLIDQSGQSVQRCKTCSWQVCATCNLDADKVIGTALHVAAYLGASTAVIGRLLDVGGRELLGTRDSAGTTARELARSQSRTEAVAEIDRWVSQQTAWEQAVKRNELGIPCLHALAFAMGTHRRLGAGAVGEGGGEKRMSGRVQEKEPDEDRGCVYADMPGELVQRVVELC
jgi:hypothetical protein